LRNGARNLKNGGGSRRQKIVGNWQYAIKIKVFLFP
jgi:hypothetical protein